MGKILLVWVNFSLSTSYPVGPVNSGFSLYKSYLTNSHFDFDSYIINISCVGMDMYQMAVNERRETYMSLDNLKTLDGGNAVDMVDVNLFYKLFKEIIDKEFPDTFVFGMKNIAIFLDKSFNEAVLITALKAKLREHYEFDVSKYTNKKSEEKTIPFVNVNKDVNDDFKEWLAKHDVDYGV
jgi:hypothetical protein